MSRLRSLPVLIGLALVSLALPWGSQQLRTGTGLQLIPGGCYTGADGWMYCDPATTAIYATAELGPPATGFTTEARILVPLALVLLVLALRRGSTTAAVLFVATGTLAIAVVGLAPSSGTVLFGATVVAGAVVLAKAQLFPRTAEQWRAWRPIGTYAST